jgi:hypothetical protein
MEPVTPDIDIVTSILELGHRNGLATEVVCMDLDYFLIPETM